MIGKKVEHLILSSFQLLQILIPKIHHLKQSVFINFQIQENKPKKQTEPKDIERIKTFEKFINTKKVSKSEKVRDIITQRTFFCALEWNSHL